MHPARLSWRPRQKFIITFLFLTDMALSGTGHRLGQRAKGGVAPCENLLRMLTLQSFEQPAAWQSRGEPSRVPGRIFTGELTEGEETE